MRHDTSPPETLAEPALPLGRSAAARGAVGFQNTQALGARSGTLLGDASERHALVIAPTGAGKGRSVLLPWLLSYAGGAIVVDPKGEAASVTARWRRQHGQTVCVVDPWHAGTSATVNPLEALLQDSDDLGDDCLTLAELIVGEAPVSLQDPFWRSLALQLLAALIGWAWVRPGFVGEGAAASEKERTLGAVWALLHSDDLAYSLAVVLDVHAKKPDFPRFVRDGFVTFLNHEAERVRTSVRSEAISLLRIFGSERVQAATATTTVPLAALQAGAPVTVYLVVPPDRLESHAAWLRVLLGTFLVLLSRRTRRPALPTLFLVDELGHLGPMPPLRQAVTLLRGYGVRVALFVQSLAQLRALWPRDHETVLENCGTWLAFGQASLTAARQVAEQLGDIAAEALFQMAPDELAIHCAGAPTQIARRLDYLSDPLFAGRFDAHPLHGR